MKGWAEKGTGRKGDEEAEKGTQLFSCVGSCARVPACHAVHVFALPVCVFTCSTEPGAMLTEVRRRGHVNCRVQFDEPGEFLLLATMHSHPLSRFLRVSPRPQWFISEPRTYLADNRARPAHFRQVEWRTRRYQPGSNRCAHSAIIQRSKQSLWPRSIFFRGCVRFSSVDELSPSPSCPPQPTQPKTRLFFQNSTRCDIRMYRIYQIK